MQADAKSLPHSLGWKPLSQPRRFLYPLHVVCNYDALLIVLIALHGKFSQSTALFDMQCRLP